jgi:hypothetical protein
MDPATSEQMAAQGGGWVAKLDQPATRVGGGVASLSILVVLWFGQQDIKTTHDTDHTATQESLADIKVWKATVTAERKAEAAQRVVAQATYEREQAAHKSRQEKRDEQHAADRAQYAKVNQATLTLLGTLTDRLAPRRRR